MQKNIYRKFLFLTLYVISDWKRITVSPGCLKIFFRFVFSQLLYRKLCNMDKKPAKLAFRLLLRKVLQYFLQGLVVLAPIGITIWVVLALFNFVDDILPNILHVFLPDLMQKDAAGNLKKIPGLGFAVVIVIVLLVGRISSSFIFSKLEKLITQRDQKIHNLVQLKKNKQCINIKHALK